MVNCCVPFCTSYSGKPISFHQFPVNLDLREAWLKAISRQNFKINDTSPSSVVCSLHFKAEDYVVGIKLKKLKPGTVPSIFTGYPSYKVPKAIKRRPQINRTASVEKIKRKNEGKEKENSKKLKYSQIEEVSVISEPIEENFIYKGETCIQAENNENNLKYCNRLLKSTLWKKNKKIQQLINEVNDLKSKLNYYEKDNHHVALEKMLCLEEHDNSVSFILQQVDNFFKKKPTFSENSIRECVLWHSISPKSYEFVVDSLCELDSSDVTERISISLASVAFVAGFIARILEKETDCPDCLEKVSSAKCDAPIFKLICNQDRGGLFYPSRELIKVLYVIQCFTDRAMIFMTSNNVVHSLTEYILPKLTRSPLLNCQIEEHRISISKTICSRYLPILLKNIVKNQNDKIRPHIFNKPLSRKVLKL